MWHFILGTFCCGKKAFYNNLSCNNNLVQTHILFLHYQSTITATVRLAFRSALEAILTNLNSFDSITVTIVPLKFNFQNQFWNFWICPFYAMIRIMQTVLSNNVNCNYRKNCYLPQRCYISYELFWKNDDLFNCDFSQ